MAEKNILIIKLGALGDFVQALGPIAAIRRHHEDARLVLLTTAPYVELAEATGFFDQVWTDSRPGRFNFAGWWGLRKRLRGGWFTRVYDLQTSARSSLYFRLFQPSPVPEWSGIAGGCSHPHDNPKRDLMHTIERQGEQLKMAGIENVPGPEAIVGLTGLNADISEFGLPGDFALLAPGGAPHRPRKRWPQEKFSQLAGRLAATGLTPVLLGTKTEEDALNAIAGDCPEAVNLAGRTDLLQIAGLARRARVAVGNDTGPMHLIAGLGCPSVVLYSADSDPALCGQRGAGVTILRSQNLADLGVDDVVAAAKAGAKAG